VLQAVFRELGSLVEVLFPPPYIVDPQQNKATVQIFCDDDARWFQFTSTTGEVNWGDPILHMADGDPPDCLDDVSTLAS
jgi:hypothetical protein